MEVTFIKTSKGTTAVPTEGNEAYLATARLIQSRDASGTIEVSDSKTHLLRSLREMKEIARRNDETFFIVAKSRPLSSEVLASRAIDGGSADDVLAPELVIQDR